MNASVKIPQQEWMAAVKPFFKTKPCTFVNEPPTHCWGRDTTFVTVVSMGIDYTDEKIASLDLTIPMEKARQEKGRVIRDAAQILTRLEITSGDMRMLVLKMLVLRTPGRRMIP